MNQYCRSGVTLTLCKHLSMKNNFLLQFVAVLVESLDERSIGLGQLLWHTFSNSLGGEVNEEECQCWEWRLYWYFVCLREILTFKAFHRCLLCRSIVSAFFLFIVDLFNVPTLSEVHQMRGEMMIEHARFTTWWKLMGTSLMEVDGQERWQRRWPREMMMQSHMLLLHGEQK